MVIENVSNKKKENYEMSIALIVYLVTCHF